MAIVNSSDSDYSEIVEAIRFRINNAYDSTDISDAKIENRACLGEGNKKIAGRIPGYASLDPEPLDRLKDAVVYQSAIEALLSESKVQSEDVEASEVTRYVNLAMKETIMRYEDAIEEIILDVAPLATRFKGSFQVFNPTKRF